MVVVGAVWVIMYNADLLLGAADRASFGRIRRAGAGAADGDGVSAGRPLPHRRDAGDVHARRVHARHGRGDVGLVHARLRGHRHVRRRLRRPRRHARPRRPIDDMRAALAARPGVARRRLHASSAASRSCRSRRARSAPGARGEPYPRARARRRLPRAHDLRARRPMASGYGSARDVWDALARPAGPGRRGQLRRPAPRQVRLLGAAARLQAQRLLLRRRRLRPGPVEVRDPQTGRRDAADGDRRARRTPRRWRWSGISTSQRTLAARSPAARSPTIHYFDARARRRPEATARRGSSRRSSPTACEAESIDEGRSTTPSPRALTFNRLIQGFMGLGLVVGVAALGVISARAVVERRQQIGVLRAIGFRRGMVQAALPARVVVRRAHGDRRRHALGLLRRLQHHPRPAPPAELGEPHARRAVAEPRR